MKTTRSIAVLVKQFPKLSETFIEGEVASLAAAGLDVRVLSIRRPTEAIVQPAFASWARRVDYLAEIPSMAGMAILLLVLFARPGGARNLLRFLRQRAGNLATLCAVLAVCRREKIGHIHAHFCSEPGAVADAAAALLGITFSISAHAKDIYVADAGVIGPRLRRAHFVTTCTRHNRDYLRRLAGMKRVDLVYHGIDTSRFQASGSEFGVSPPLLIAVGRMRAKKGFDVLIKACVLLRLRGLHFQCRIHGYGEEQGKLQSLIEELDVEDCVRLCPPVSHAVLPRILDAATAFALPCRITADGDRDGIPNSLLEAMAMELPVVSTRVSAVPEVLEHGRNGLLVDPDDCEGLAGALEMLLADHRLRIRLGQAARRTVETRFCWRRNIMPLVELLEEFVRAPDLTLQEAVR